MFDDILNAVKEHLSNNPEVAAAIPAEHADSIHNEIATHLTNSVAGQSSEESGGLSGGGSMLSGLLGKLESSIASGGAVTNAIEGGLVSSLASKFGLPPSVTGAIAGALPGILQKYVSKKV